jgi:hypothetical protein
MAEEDQPVGSSAAGEHHPNGRGPSIKNSLKTPLLEKVHSRSRPVTREESKIQHTWVYTLTFFAVMGNIALGYAVIFFIFKLLSCRSSRCECWRQIFSYFSG